ncbi:WhiB family transcriptional regulator, partial [Dermabacteraceae bacterium P13101]
MGWAGRGLCTNLDPDAFFVQGAEQQQVKARCGPCPVRLECLATVLAAH